VIVRISGQGQFELDDSAAKRLDQIDTQLTSAIEANDEESFRRFLKEAIGFVEQSGKPLDPTRVVPSNVIIPPDDITLSEARQFFTDEGLMAPLPA
jgi:hypothetical protein